MLTTPAQLLEAREGSLQDTPLPLLLHALNVEERTGTLELKVRQLEKRIVFEDGAPVACHTNLLHETLGKFLVDKGRLPEAEYQKALAESVSTGVQMGELLVRKGLISPYDLYRQLQANLAQKVLDCFRWTEARFRWLGDDGEDEGTHVRMNTAQLVLTGVTTVMPFDAVATHFTFTDDRRFVWTPWASPAAESLKLSPKDTRLVQALKELPTFDAVCSRTGLDTEAAMRRLYALAVLGLGEGERGRRKPCTSAAPSPRLPPRPPKRSTPRRSGNCSVFEPAVC